MKKKTLRFNFKNIDSNKSVKKEKKKKEKEEITKNLLRKTTLAVWIKFKPYTLKMCTLLKIENNSHELISLIS